MKIGLFQFAPEWENKENNKKKILDIIESQEISHDLIIFPEMTLTGFSMESEKISDEPDSESHLFFAEIAKKYNTNVIAGITEKENGCFYNTLIHFSKDGNIASRYRKIHLFSLADEQNHYTPGNSLVITSIDGLEAGLSICYDIRFPEMFRIYGKEKVELIIAIASWPVKRIEHWKAILKARAVENLVYVAAVNRTGNDVFQQYNGNSMIIDPMGNEIIRIEDKEGLFTAEINPEFVNEIRSKLNFLEDIRLI